MEYEEISFSDIREKGTKLGNKKLNYPVLYNNTVYKKFTIDTPTSKVVSFCRKKANLLLKLEKLNLKYLVKTKSILTLKEKPYGYTYTYQDYPLLKNYFDANHSLNERLNYIYEVLTLEQNLKSVNLTYPDLHSANLLMAPHALFIDTESIIEYNPYLKRYLNEYLLAFILSIYLNYDLTCLSDITPFIYLIDSYFPNSHILDFTSTNFSQIIKIMQTKSLEEISYLKRQIKSLEV